MHEVTMQNAAAVAARAKTGELFKPAASLAEAMARVMEQVGYVQKTGVMEFGSKYKFASEAAFIAALRPELVRQQIVVCPVAMEPLVTEVFQGKSAQNRVVLRVTWRFTHAPSKEFLDVVTCGEGIDSGDKATNKAMTGAMKYALRQAFVIETGNDPDETPSEKQERKAEPARPTVDSAALREQHASNYARCKTYAEYLAARKAVVADIEGGKLNKEDIAALKALDTAALAKCPAPAKV